MKNTADRGRYTGLGCESISPKHFEVDDEGIPVLLTTGPRAVEAARRSGFAGPVTMIGAETYLPYDRPPLSKESSTPPTTVSCRPVGTQGCRPLLRGRAERDAATRPVGRWP